MQAQQGNGQKHSPAPVPHSLTDHPFPMLGTDTLRILRTVASPSRMFTVQVWCKHSLFQVSCGLTYAPEYVHCLEYDLHIASAYSHNATSKKFQVSCSIHIYSLRYDGNWKQLPLHNSSCIDTLSPQVSLLSSNFRL